MNCRRFLGYTAASAAAVTIVPRHVPGGPGRVAPSEKIALALIGCRTLALPELIDLLALPQVRVVAVCDSNQNLARSYRPRWGLAGLS
jgi:hypothetical protein